jgi:hypothetical protein
VLIGNNVSLSNKSQNKNKQIIRSDSLLTFVCLSNQERKTVTEQKKKNIELVVPKQLVVPVTSLSKTTN